MTLASGMVISYLDVGAADGEVMLYFHGTPSSRMQAAGPVEAAAARLGVRVIAPDRPGCGDSSFVRYRVADCPAIVARFADSLGIGEFGVIIGPALIAVYAITTGAAAIAGEEDRGVLEVRLSAPVSRIRCSPSAARAWSSASPS